MGTGGSFPREILASLKQLQLPLRGLCVDVCMNTEELIFKDLLQVHAETLERLYVIKGNGVSYPNFPFGLHLPNLTNLDVGSGIITNLNFLKQTPSLKAITVGVCTGKSVGYDNCEYLLAYNHSKYNCDLQACFSHLSVSANSPV